MSLKCTNCRAHMRCCEMPNHVSINKWGGKVQLRGNMTNYLDWQEMWAGLCWLFALRASRQTKPRRASLHLHCDTAVRGKWHRNADLQL